VHGPDFAPVYPGCPSSSVPRRKPHPPPTKAARTSDAPSAKRPSHARAPPRAGCDTQARHSKPRVLQSERMRTLCLREKSPRAAGGASHHKTLVSDSVSSRWPSDDLTLVTPRKWRTLGGIWFELRIASPPTPVPLVCLELSALGSTTPRGTTARVDLSRIHLIPLRAVDSPGLR